MITISSMFRPQCRNKQVRYVSTINTCISPEDISNVLVLRFIQGSSTIL